MKKTLRKNELHGSHGQENWAGQVRSRTSKMEIRKCACLCSDGAHGCRGYPGTHPFSIISGQVACVPVCRYNIIWYHPLGPLGGPRPPAGLRDFATLCGGGGGCHMILCPRRPPTGRRPWSPPNGSAVPPQAGGLGGHFLSTGKVAFGHLSCAGDPDFP